MRVTMIIQAFAPVLGGAQRQVEALAPLLDKRGFQIDVITRRPPGTQSLELRPGARIHRVSAGRGGVASLAYTVRGAARTLRLRPEIIHAHDLLSPSTIALLASAPSHVPVVVKVLQTGHGGDIDRLLRKPLGRRRLEAICNRFAAFVCLSDEIEHDLRQLGVAAERLWRIPNGVDTDRFRPAAANDRALLRAKLGLPVEGMVALYCGRLYASKRVDMLIGAMQEAPGTLVIVGEGPTENELRRIVREAGLQGRVEFRGTVEDTAPLYAAADVYVTASAAEGMSNSVLEAMATGLPVIGVHASAMREQLSDGAGILLERADPAAFAERLKLLEGSLELRQRVGRTARDRTIRRYSVDTVADALSELYTTIAASGKTRRGRALSRPA
jgi:glycosyltransferase involved in cell wall biosynthesis